MNKNAPAQKKQTLPWTGQKEAIGMTDQPGSKHRPNFLDKRPVGYFHWILDYYYGLLQKRRSVEKQKFRVLTCLVQQDNLHK